MLFIFIAVLMVNAAMAQKSAELKEQVKQLQEQIKTLEQKISTLEAQLQEQPKPAPERLSLNSNRPQFRRFAANRGPYCRANQRMINRNAHLSNANQAVEEDAVDLTDKKIYTGPRGCKFYIDENGRRRYIKNSTE